MPKNKLLKLLLILLIAVITGRSYTQYDSIAISIPDSMSDDLSSLETCSYKFTSEYEKRRNRFSE